MEKPLSDGQNRVKAPLVVRGFEEDGKVQADSPTASKSTFRIAFAVIANEGSKCETTDTKAGFLQGRRIERNVFVKPPREVIEDGIVWKLEKAAYGLDDASRHWYCSVREDLISFDCKQSEIDMALFQWYQDDQLKGIFLIYVDDFLFAGIDQFFGDVIDKITNKYQIGKHQNRSFTYVGLKVEESSSEIMISQNEYISEMKEIVIARTRQAQRQTCQMSPCCCSYDLYATKDSYQFQS